MSSYFYCPGAANVSSTTVECSVGIQTYTPPESGGFTIEHFNQLFVLFLMYWAIHFVFQQVKKAIEQ